MPHGDDAPRLFDEFGLEALDILGVERLLDLDAIDAKHACDDLGRLQRAQGRATPDLQVCDRDILHQSQRHGKARLDAAATRARKLTIPIGELESVCLRLGMSHEHQLGNHVTPPRN